MTRPTASEIVSATIDADYPVAGQDNDSQGFRDNFSVIKDGLATANSEITDLQINTARLDVDNNFGGNLIDNAKTNRLYGSVYTTTSTPTTNVSLENGEYQAITINGNHTLTFVDWPETDLYAKIRIALKSAGTIGNITFATEGGGIIRKEISPPLASASNVTRKLSAVATTTATFSFPTTSLTQTIYAGDYLFGTGLSGSVQVTNVASLTPIATATTQPSTLGYTSIAGNGQVTTSSTAASVATGSIVRFNNVTGMGGLSTSTDYYAYDASGLGFKIASTLSNAFSGTPVAGLAGTIEYTAIADDGRVTTSTSASGIPTGDTVTLSDVTGVTGLATGTTYYVFDSDATGFNLADSYANALAGTGILGLTGAFAGVGTATWSGVFIGTGTATFPELDPNSNRVTVNSTSNMYVGMPIGFTGTVFGGLATATTYYITKIIDSTGIRISTSSGGPSITLTTASGTSAITPTTVITADIDSQTVSSSSGLTITTANTTFPEPLAVSSDVNKIKVIEAWTADGGTNVFIKYLGEYA